MTSQSQSNNGDNTSNKPLFRVYAAAKTGRFDRTGNEQLGKIREVGAIWNREGKAFDLVSIDLPMNTADAVFFIGPVDTDTQGGAQ